MQIGFFGLLSIVFITLKLTGYIDWSWWLVLSPIWVVIAILILIIVLAAVVGVLTDRPVRFYVRKKK